MKNKNEVAVFGGGCFWCTEATFKMLKGVVSVEPGYAGGKTENPSYEDVNEGISGHAEVIKVDFDPKIIPYKSLLDIFWHTHDPTTMNRQGVDIGTQYRSIIFYTSDEQKKMAEQELEKLKKLSEFKDPIVTEIKSLKKFYEAETYHKDYYQNNPDALYCQLVISPKLQHLREKYLRKLKFD